MDSWLNNLMAVIVCVLMAAATGANASASVTVGRGVEQRLVSSWLGVVDGEVRTRTLTIVGLRPASGQTIAADAAYGITGDDILPARCTITTGAEQTRLSVADFHGDRFEALEVYDGWFIGTYTYKDGRETSITLGRISQENLQKNQFTVSGDAQITVLYFGAEDCPHSAAWEKEEQVAFRHSKEYGHVDFRSIKRRIHNRGPSIDDFPHDLRWLYEDAETGGVSPYYVVVVDRTIVLRTYGRHNWERKVTPLLKELCARKMIARSPALAE
jgi:hypothetical protein